MERKITRISEGDALRLSRAILALFFVVAGSMHFLSPTPYLAITPAFVPWPKVWIVITGVAEIAGGLGILFAKTRWLAALGLILLLIGVFPANIHAALHGMTLFGQSVPPWLLLLRLPLQPVLIAWVYVTCWKEPKVPR